jgi:excinuclease UvrABC nuclease subunit
MTTLADVRRAVEDYCTLHCLKMFNISDLVDIQATYKGTPLTPAHLPYQGGPGCYLFWDNNSEPLYIGKASGRNTIASRLYAYFKWNRVIAQAIFRFTWGSSPVYVSTIEVRFPYEAPSLEEYLIWKLHPPANTHGRSKKAP